MATFVKQLAVTSVEQQREKSRMAQQHKQPVERTWQDKYQHDQYIY
jgi:hypothetical protein